MKLPKALVVGSILYTFPPKTNVPFNVLNLGKQFQISPRDPMFATTGMPERLAALLESMTCVSA